MWITKQKYDRSMEQFDGTITEIAQNCKLEPLESDLIRDTFIFNMNEDLIHSELLKETVSPECAPQIAKNFDHGLKTKTSIESNRHNLVTSHEIQNS